MQALLKRFFPLTCIAGLILGSVAAPAAAGLFADTAAGPQTMLLDDMALQHQRMTQAVLLIERGKPQAYAQLRDSYVRVTTDMKLLQGGGSSGTCKLPEPAASLKPQVQNLAKALVATDQAAHAILDVEKQQNHIWDAARNISKASPDLQELVGQLLVLRVADRAAPGEVSSISSLSMLLVRLSKSANELALDEEVSPEKAFMLGKDANTFGEIVKGLREGSELLHLSPAKGEAKDKAALISKRFEGITADVNAILQNLQRLIVHKQAVSVIINESAPALHAMQAVRNQLPAGETCMLGGNK